MRKIIYSFIGVFVSVSFCLIGYYFVDNSQSEMANLRKQHKEFLNNSPFKETLKLSKEERKAKRLTPNKFYERQWELTMNPSTGKPEPEKLFELQEILRQNDLFNKVPGEKTNIWTERGPNNVGGRTRAIMFDPNDVNGKRVFAGGVSGGLWVNNDITDSNSAWSEVDIPANLAINCITYDPNNSATFYVGTGESYVGGQANGNGVWKSTDGGLNWTRVFGGVTGDTYVIPDSGIPNGDVKVTVNSPGNIAGDYFGFNASFGSVLTSLSGSLVLADDGSAAPNEACNALVNGGAIAGNIAVLYRGSCEFGVKVLNAENAGAIAVIVINNVAGEPIVMGPGAVGDQVTIPSLMLSQADGQAIIDQLASGVNVDIETVPFTRDYSGYTAKPGVQHINDIKIRDIGGGNSEVYVAAGTSFYGDATPRVLLGPEDFGLYKSINGGSSWSKIEISDAVPNDIEISTDNTVWVSSTDNAFGDSAGEIFASSDGVNFSLKHKVAGGLRTQIAVSGSNASTLYVLAESTSQPVEIFYTDDAFKTTASLSLPDDADTGIPANDFTRGQAFYDLMIEVDPNNDNIVYVGGIDLFKTMDGGSTWDQLSHWYGGFGFQEVHADQHAMTFLNNSSSIMIFSNDGGVYYSNDSGTTISSRNKNYNTLQFYKGAIGQEVGGNEKLLAGAQDNGSQLINNASAGINGSIEVTGGDGGYCFIDEDNGYMVSSYVYNSFYYLNYASGFETYTIDSDQNSGDFINPSVLDSADNSLYTNGSSGTTYQVNRYKLGASSATKTTLKNALLDGAPTAFKMLSSSFFFKNLLVGTENGKLFKVGVSTSSSSWTEITGTNFVGSISCIELGATENDIYVTFYNYGVTNIFYSNNGGTSWQNKEGDFPDIPVRAIMPNPLNPNEVIIGTDLGVWGTTDFSVTSPNWYRANNGMKDVPVHSFDLRTSDNTVLAATHGRGMFTGQFTADASTLSIENIDFNDMVKIYPTVSDGAFKIAARNDVRQGTLNIYDLSGKEVYASKLDFNRNLIQEVSVNVSGGMYIVKFKSDDKQSTHKIIIN
jgi:hypothetical protein